VVSKLLFATAFQSHPCRHPVIGHRQVFDQLRHEDLVTFYKRHYVPNNLFLVAVGPFDESALLRQAEASFGAIPRAPKPPAVLPAEPRQHGQRVVHQEGKTELAHLRIAWQAPDLTDRDTGHLSLVSAILGSGRSSRLYQSLRERDRLVHSIGAYLYAMGDTGLFVVAAEVDAEKREAAETAIFREVQALRASGPTDAERDKALNSYLADSLDGLTTTRGIASDLGSSWFLTGNPEFTRDLLDAVQDATSEDLQRVARHWLDPSHATIVSLNPEGTLPPASARTVTRDRAATQVHTLPNGLTLLVKADPRLPLVTVHSASRAGLLAEADDTAGGTRLLSRLLTRDTASASASAISERIESVGGSFSSFSGSNSVGLDAQVMAPHWELALQTLADGLTSASLAPALEREREAQLASIRSELDRPMTIAFRLLRDALFPGHPYRHGINGTAESVTALRLDQLAALRDRTLTGTNTVLAVYGDVDPEAVLARANSLLASLPAGDRLFRDTSPVPSREDTNRIEQFHRKEQAIVLFGFPIPGLRDPDTLALELLADACSDMSSRFFNRIREDLGAAYSVGATHMHGFAGGSFTFYAATSREQADQVEDALRSEITHLAREGLESGEFERAKKSWHGSHQNRLQALSSQASIHTLDELYDFGWNRSDESPRRMDRLSPGTLQMVATRHFLDRPHVIVRYLPEAE
jgi:zinc protease